MTATPPLPRARGATLLRFAYPWLLVALWLTVLAFFMPTWTAPAATVDPTPEPSPVEVLLEQHDCWTGDSPYGDLIPGHAIATLPNTASPQFVSSDVGFGIWLDGDPGTLHAFCR